MILLHDKMIEKSLFLKNWTSPNYGRYSSSSFSAFFRILQQRKCICSAIKRARRITSAFWWKVLNRHSKVLKLGQKKLIISFWGHFLKKWMRQAGSFFIFYSPVIERGTFLFFAVKRTRLLFFFFLESCKYMNEARFFLPFQYAYNDMDC